MLRNLNTYFGNESRQQKICQLTPQYSLNGAGFHPAKIHSSKKSKISLLFLLLSLFFSFPQVKAQDSLYQQVKKVSSNLSLSRKQSRKVLKPFNAAKDSLQFIEAQNNAAQFMAADGFPGFSLDSHRIEGKSLKLWFYQGAPYFHASIDPGKLNETTLQKSGIPKLVQKKAPFDQKGFEAKLAWCLNEYQGQGYPFARFDSLKAEFSKGKGDSILVQLSYAFEPGNLVLVDSLIFNGKKREKDEFIQSLVGIRPGDPYNQSLLDELPNELNNSIYYKRVKTPQVIFEEKKAKIIVELEQKKTGKYDLLVGLLPPRDDNARFDFTILGDFRFVSSFFKAGEVFQFKYEKFTGTSQKLHISYAQPYILSTPLKISGEFDMQKQDTSFLTRFFRLSGAYSFTPNLSVRAFYKFKASRLISTSRFKDDSLNVPEVLDGRDQTYGLGFKFENLDYKFNPRKGWSIRMDFGIGRKKVLKNKDIHEDIYSGLRLTLPKTEADFSIDWYRSLSKRFVLRLANKTYWLDQEQYFENDLLQVGGSRSIRGFNENSFFTDFYTFFSLENRFILERNSYLFVFGDYAYLQNQIGQDRLLRPFGFGLGMTYETRAGMVSLTYAVGQVKDLPLQPSRGRIHVGLINQF